MDVGGTGPGGRIFSNDGVPPNVSRYNFVPMELRLGLITDIGFADGLLRGQFEPMLGLSGGAVFNGAGTGYIGPSLTLRYNFVQPNWRLVPYVQVCGGITYNDGYKDTTQVALSSGMEFLLQGQIGVRYFIWIASRSISRPATFTFPMLTRSCPITGSMRSEPASA